MGVVHQRTELVGIESIRAFIYNNFIAHTSLVSQ